MDKPGIILAFDDCFISEWYECLPFFARHNMRVTFYLAYLSTIDSEQWKKLQAISEAGHVIGFHGLNHMRAGEVSKPPNDPTRKHQITSWEEFLDVDIRPGIELLSEHFDGWYKHYAYPYGNRSDESDKVLLRYFHTLRTGGRNLYPVHEVPRVYATFDFGKKPDEQLCGHEGLVKVAGEQEKIVAFHMHRPVIHRLEFLAAEATHYGLTFYTANDIE